jgi:hypothetical protein
MSGKIKVKCIKENKYGLAVGKEYDAYTVKSPLANKGELLCVVDDYGEEYAYSSDLFERIDNI